MKSYETVSKNTFPDSFLFLLADSFFILFADSFFILFADSLFYFIRWLTYHVVESKRCKNGEESVLMCSVSYEALYKAIGEYRIRRVQDREQNIE